MNHFLFPYPPSNNNTKQTIFMPQGQVLKRLKGEDGGSQCTFEGETPSQQSGKGNTKTNGKASEKNKSERFV